LCRRVGTGKRIMNETTDCTDLETAMTLNRRGRRGSRRKKQRLLEPRISQRGIAVTNALELPRITRTRHSKTSYPQITQILTDYFPVSYTLYPESLSMPQRARRIAKKDPRRIQHGDHLRTPMYADLRKMVHAQVGAMDSPIKSGNDRRGRESGGWQEILRCAQNDNICGLSG